METFALTLLKSTHSAGIIVPFRYSDRSEQVPFEAAGEGPAGVGTSVNCARSFSQAFTPSWTAFASASVKGRSCRRRTRFFLPSRKVLQRHSSGGRTTTGTGHAGWALIGSFRWRRKSVPVRVSPAVCLDELLCPTGLVVRIPSSSMKS